MATSPPTDQRAGVRPISFALENLGAISQTVTLLIRPEDLTRTEPMRVSVHQTMGRSTQGWIDDFGPGLPTVQLSGHTGWRGGETEDGAKAFETLNTLVQKSYPAYRQAAVDAGIDPAGVKLIFADMLDGFVYPVQPMQFVLRRSKSRPLLFQYQIQLQAIGTSIDNPEIFRPNLGDFSSGLTALDAAISDINSMAGSVEAWVSAAVSVVDRGLAPVGKIVAAFVRTSNTVFSAAQSVQKGMTKASASVINLARDMATVGRNALNTISAIKGLPATVRANVVRVERAYNAVLCLFSNALRAKRTVPDYGDLYGASNCSSTTGGGPLSPLAGLSVLSSLLPSKSGLVTITPMVTSSIGNVKNSDPVLAPMSIREIGSHLSIITGGVAVA